MFVRPSAARFARSACALSVAAAFFVVAVGGASSAGCSNTISTPPISAGCTRGDAACTVPLGIGGGPGGPKPSDAGAEGDTSVLASSDAGTCGVADMLVGAATQNLICLPCITGSAETGTLSCCNADTACSEDPGCRTLVSCALTCAGSATCVANCETSNSSSAASIGNYNAFGGCLAQNCSPECPSLPEGSSLTTADL